MLEMLFNLFKVKFVKLNELICDDKTLNIEPKKPVNIYINLESIFKKLAHADVEDYLRIKTNERAIEMISCIINLAAHYRLFFTRNRIYSNIFIYLGFPFKSFYKNKLIIEDYREYYRNKFTTNPKYFVLSDVITQSIPFAKIIMEYMEGVYLIQGEHIEPSLIPYIINKDVSYSDNNIIITTDRYEYQYVNKGFSIIRPKRDKSYLINKYNAIDIMKTEDKVDTSDTVESEFIPFIISILGDKYRNIEKFKRTGLTSLLKFINKARDNNIIGKNVYNINILKNMVQEEYHQDILNNFLCSEIESQYQLLNISDLHVIKSQIVDKFDNEQLKKLNQEHFSEHPLYLMEILDSLKYKNKVRKKIF